MLTTRGQALLGFSAVALGLVAAGSCLPDLSVAVVPATTCGDGVVDLSLGEACDPGDAGGGGCTTGCRISCEGGAIDPRTDHCYFWVPGVQLKDNGVSECKARGAHVVHFASLQELSVVIAECKGLPGAPDSGATWTALEKAGMPLEGGLQTYTASTGYELDLPGWSAACPGCFAAVDGGDADLPVGPTGGSCVFWPRAIDQSWFQSACDLTSGALPVLCEREPAGAFSRPCADASGTCIEVRFTKGKKSYVLETTPSSFDSAAAACHDDFGGRLASFGAPEEREAVAGEIARWLPAGDVWIGLSFDDDAGAWRWSDGTSAPASSPTPWGDGEPDGGAGARGVLRLAPGAYDTKLVHVQPDATVPLPYLCEVPL